MKLKFEKGKNTKLVTFRVDPLTSQHLTTIRNYYSKESNRRVTTCEIIKQLINLHHQEMFEENND